MPRVTFNRLSRKKASSRKRPTSVVTRARYQKPTAKNQRKQIMGNAMAIRAVKRILPPPVYCDWQYGGTMYAQVDTTGAGAYTQTVLSRDLMSPQFWLARLRQDPNVADSSSTRVLRMGLNLRYALQESNYAQITAFVVTLRRNASNREPATLVDGEDYILSPSQDFNPRLNPAVFKVHYVRNISLTQNNWLSPAVATGGADFAGNPQTTFRKGQVNLKLNLNLRQPNLGAPWKQMTQGQLKPELRYSLLVFVTAQGSNPNANTGARIDFDVLYTTLNAS